MKILVTGAGGQVGHEVCRVLSQREIDYCGLDHGALDITDCDMVHRQVVEYRPDAVIHCAAWTAVDRAQDQPEDAFRVNVTGTRNVARACREAGAKMLYLSSDYVFPGEGERFYEPDDPTEALNVYGQTKLEGERAVQQELTAYFIVRTSWVFGAAGGNFVNTMLRLAQTRGEVTVVCDQFGSPTYAADLAPLLCDMVCTQRYGIYHATNEGICSWAEFARAIFALSGAVTEVQDVPASLYPARAVRPYNSRLSKEKLVQMGFSRLPPWQDALRRYMQEIQYKDHATMA